MMAHGIESKSVQDICNWLEEKGFSESLIECFRDEEIDGDAVAAGMASSSGTDWLRDVVPKVGLRLKVHSCLHSLFTQCQPGPSTSFNDSEPPMCLDEVFPQESTSNSPFEEVNPITQTMSEELTPKPASKMATLPCPFPIPKFRQNTEKNFHEKILTDTDRKYVVQTMATMMMTYIQKPSLHHCSVVAKALIKKYDFLKDSEGDGEHSWKWFLYYQCQNINRSSRQDCIVRSKRPKIQDCTAHLYPPIYGEDDVSYGRNQELLKAEMAKPKPRFDVLKDLINRTFSNRWEDYVQHKKPASLFEYLNLFPLLKKTAYANIDFNLVCKKEDMREHFENSFPLWAKAIITYCKDTQVRSTALQIETANYTKDMDDDCCAMLALRCLTLLCVPMKSKALCESLPYILKVVPRGTPPSEASDKSNNQPHIVLFSDEDFEAEDRLQQFFICVEQNLMLECSNIITAVFFCIAAHYIFNLDYHPKSGGVWLLIQEKIINIPSKPNVKRHPSITSHFSGIARVYESLAAAEVEE